jgi:hypothetical protein
MRGGADDYVLPSRQNTPAEHIVDREEHRWVEHVIGALPEVRSERDLLQVVAARLGMPFGGATHLLREELASAIRARMFTSLHQNAN